MKSLSQCIERMINNEDRRTTAKRLAKVSGIKDSLENPMQSLEDDTRYICEKEEEFFGVSLTYSVSDMVNFQTNYECDTVLDQAPVNKTIYLCCSVSRYNEIKTKTGKNPGQKMCFATLEDSSGRLDKVAIFPDNYNSKVQSLLYDGSVVIAKGKVSKKRDLFIVEELKQA